MVNYHIPGQLSVLRDRVKAEFRRNEDLNDLHMIDIAIFRGEQELDETVKMFKTPTHVWRYIDPEVVKGKNERLLAMGVGKSSSEFMTNFYANTTTPY